MCVLSKETFEHSSVLLLRGFCLHVCRLIMHSKCLLEVDLEDNFIGELGGEHIVEALQVRKDGNSEPLCTCILLKNILRH